MEQKKSGDWGQVGITAIDDIHTSDTYRQEQRELGQHWGAAGTVQRRERGCLHERKRTSKQSRAGKQQADKAGRRLQQVLIGRI